MSSLWLTAATSLLVVVLWILWRVWPLLAGIARAGDPQAVRLVKWNRYLLKLLRKNLKSQVAVAQVGFFKGERDAREHSLATWILSNTLIPDVEYLLLAHPETQEIHAVAPAKALREMLEGAVIGQTLWGHHAWIYVWPDEVEPEAFFELWTPLDEFKREHGLKVEDDLLLSEAPGGEPLPVAPSAQTRSEAAQKAQQQARRRRNRRRQKRG